MHDVDWLEKSAGELVDDVHGLRDGRVRERTGRFFVEGTRFLIRAVERRARIDVVLHCPEFVHGPAAADLLGTLARLGVPLRTVDRKTFAACSTSHEPQGLAAVVRQRWESLADVRPLGRSTWIALQHVRSPGNLGTLLRTADATGAAGLFCVGREVDPYHPNVVRPTMGSLFESTFVRTSVEKLRRWADTNDAFLVGASGDGEVEYDEVRYPPRTVVVLGDERKGLSRRLRSACDLVTRIPMCGTADSLNMAVAGSLMLYEVYRQRQRAVMSAR